MRQALKILADAIFPPRCGCCAALVESQGRLCTECWQGLQFIQKPYCAACGYPFAYSYAEEASLCSACMQHKPHYDGHRAMFHFEGTAQKLVHDLKYYDKPLLLPLCAEWLANAGAEFLQEDSLVMIPIPLHYLRLWKRRYNQAALLASALSKRSGHPVFYAALQRIKRRPPQASLNRAQRLKNMRGAFAVNPKGLA